MTGWHCTGHTECLPVQVDAAPIDGAPDVMTFERDADALEVFMLFKQVAAKLVKPGEEFG